MKRLVSLAPGGPEHLVIEDAPDPRPAHGQVLVRVRACGVNYPDVLIIEDKYQFKPQRPFAPGGELAGEVIAVGAGVTTLAPGDRVCAMIVHGAMAELAVLSEHDCFPVPADMDWDVAAAFLFTFASAYHALHDRAQVQAGQSVCVLGAAGGVGLALVQLAKAAGARVIAAVSSADKAELARAHGADDAIVYPRGPFEPGERRALSDLFRDALGKDGADVICDVVGGDYAEAALRAIAWNGHFLIVGFPAGIPKIALNLPLLKECVISGVFTGAFQQKFPDRFRANAARLFDLWRAGKAAPHISARYPLAEGGRAIEDLAARRALGKIVVYCP